MILLLNVELIGTPSIISEGVAILLFTKLHLITRPFTVEPTGIKVELNESDVDVDGPYDPAVKPIRGLIEPLEANVKVGVLVAVGRPVPDQ